MKKNILISAFLMLFLSTALYGQTYRYLKISTLLCTNHKYQEIDWFDDGVAYPNPHLTDYISNGMEVYGDYGSGVFQSWEIFLPYDGDPNTHAWQADIDDTLLLKEIVLDLGDGNGIFPDSIWIDKCCGNLTRFQCWASNDNENWDLFLDTTLLSANFSERYFPLHLNTDILPPTSPSDLTAAYITSSTLALFWQPSLDNVEVTEYEIFQDGFSIGTTNNTNYYVSGLLPTTSYEYYVTAKDYKGNESEPSDTVNLITNETDAEAPYLPANLTAENITSNSVDLLWASATDNVGVTGYIIYLDGVPVGTTEETTFSIPGLNSSTDYDITVKAKDAAGNYSVNSNIANVTTNASGAAERMIGTNFWFISGTGSDPFKETYEAVSGENPWKTELLNELSIYTTLRFMDWGRTNASNDSSWAQRSEKENINQRILAYEWMIDLCNKMDKNIWICIPHKVVSRNGLEKGTNNYIKKLAILLKTGVDMKQTDLDLPRFNNLSEMTRQDFIYAGGVPICEPLKPQLRIYIEYSNETWNFAPAFTQSTYCVDEGEALNLGGSNEYHNGRRFHAWAALHVFEEMEAVFGTGTPRLIKLDAYQAGGTSHIENHLVMYDSPVYNPLGIYPDAFSPAPYFGGSVNGGDVDAVSQLQLSILDRVDRMRTDLTYINTQGSTRGRDFKFIAYEGGQHVLTNADVINRDPQMYDLYIQYLDSMTNIFDEFVHYAHSGEVRTTGAWGAKEYIGQDISSAHKYRAIVGVHGSGPEPVDTTKPSIPANLTSLTVGKMSISIIWNVSSDNDEVAGYQIFQNGFYIGYCTDTIFEISGLSPNTDYSYMVKAKDATGNFSEYSDPVVISTLSEDIPVYTLTVENGSGSGDYAKNELRTIIADPAPVDSVFDAWTGDVLYVTDINNSTTTITMPANAVSVAATYTGVSTTYTVTFTIGNGSIPLENVTVSFNSEVKITNAGGVAVFNNVAPDTDLAYSVVLYGYDNVNGVVNVVDSDVSELITMSEENTGIDEFKNISIYPNPAHEVINFINIENVSNINIYTISKVLVKSYKVQDENQMKIDVSDLSKGMYFIQLVTDNGRISKQQVIY